MNFAQELYNCSDYSCIFSLVKRAVQEKIKKRRVGLSLGLSNLPNHIGAFHQVGSNFIIINKNLLEEIFKTGEKEKINSYIFHILLHEYLHTLGFINEQETQILTHKISESTLGENHPATLMARYGLSHIFSGLDMNDINKTDDSGVIEIVEDFETENMNYFG